MSRAREEQIDAAFDVLERHINQLEKNFLAQGKRPRDKDWYPVRFAVRDVILAWVVARLDVKNNVMEVDVYLTYDPKESIPGWSGTKFAAVYILSQAYKSGSSMGIRFTKNVESGTVPVDVVDMAEDYGVVLGVEHIHNGVITPKEARQLYIALTEFSSEAQRKVMELSLADKVSPERICYMVHHLTYTKGEMESLLLGTEFPENILLGKVTPEEYLLYQDVVLRSRDVVLGGMLDRMLLLKEVVDEDGKVVDLEGNDRRISIGFDPRFFAKVYGIEEETPIPWTVYRDLVVRAGERLVVLVRARDWADFEYYFAQDLEAIQAMKESYAEGSTHFFMLVPRNVLELKEPILESYRVRLARIGATLMICPESVALLDQDVRRRLRESETMRHDIGSGEGRLAISSINQPGFNATEIQLVAVPRDLRIGRLSLSRLIEQAMYDEDELSRGVNKHNVRARYHLVCDRMQFLALQALTAKYQSVKVDQAAFTILSALWNKAPARVRATRLLPVFWMPEHMGPYASGAAVLTEASGAFGQIVRFLELACESDQAVIAVQNKHSRQLAGEAVGEVPLQELTGAFAGQFVPDWINDFGGIPFEEVVVKQLWRAVKSAARGQPNGVNLSEVPHMVITAALHKMVYESPAKAGNKEVGVNIVYTDGSQARPFPLFCLKRRSDEEMVSLRALKPIRIGEISMRHPEMDTVVHQYWFRNIEVSQPGMTSAELDELCYQTALMKLADIYRLSRPVRIVYYQTGFQAPLVGFWRAVIEFLRVGQGKTPMLEVVPCFYDKRLKGGQQYRYGDPWH